MTDGLLAGVRVVLTRARNDMDDLAGALERLGAEIIRFPTIRIEPIPGALDKAAANLERYDWIVFTSRNGASIYLEEMAKLLPGRPPCAHARVAATGSATADVLIAGGVKVDLVPEVSVSEGLVDALSATGRLNGTRFLLPRAAAGRDVLPQMLTQYGAEVESVALYKTLPDTDHPDDLLERLRKGEADLLVFASPSAVRSFTEQVGDDLLRSPRTTAAVIGPVTAEAVRAAGGNPEIIPEKFDARSLVTEIEKWGAERRNKT